MLPYKSLIKIDKKADTPVYLQISQQLVNEIIAGRIAANTKLPGTRKFSEILKVNRNTIIASIEELKAQGWLVSKSSSGTFVNSDLLEVNEGLNKTTSPNLRIKQTQPNLNQLKYHFDDGHPDVRLAPLLSLTREMSALVKTDYFHRNLNYTDEFQGDVDMRGELVNYLQDTRGIKTTAENVLLTRGTIMSFHLIISNLMSKGDRVIVGKPGYTTFNHTVEREGGELIHLPVDENGLQVHLMEEICLKFKIKFVYVIPHHHHPTTVRLSAERRMKLLALSKKHDFTIIEDDYDFDFHFDNKPILPLSSYSQDPNIIYVGSFSKLLVPSIRLGFLIAPQHIIKKLVIARRFIDRCGDPLVERAMANLMQSGLIGRHLRKSKRVYRKRRDLLMSLIDDHLSVKVIFTKPAGGMAIWVRFDDSIDISLLIKTCAELGLFISNPHHYNHDDKQMTRLGFASMDEVELKIAFEILKKCVLDQQK